MNRKIVRTISVGSFALVVVLSAAWSAQTQDAQGHYLTMAPLDQYLMADRDAEIALARSAAPESISRDAEVLVLGRHGYETAVKGKNGFVCIVDRAWTSDVDDPDFLNPARGNRSASMRQPRDPTCHSPSRRQNGHWLDRPKLRCLRVSRSHTTKKNCPCRNLAECPT